MEKRGELSERVQVKYSGSLLLKEISSETYLEIVNISSGGLSFLPSHKLQKLSIGDCVHALLSINSVELKIELEIRNVRDNAIGCLVKSKDNVFHSYVADFFKGEIMAMRLVRIKDEILNRPIKGMAHWYRCKSGNELYFIEEKGALLSFYIKLLGHEVRMEDGGRYSVNGEFSLDYIEHIERFVKSASDIDKNIVNQIVEKLEQLSID